MSTESKALAPIEEVRRSLTQMKDQFKTALPPQVDPDRFIRVTMTAIQNTPALLKCDRHSLYGACMRAAQSGLLPDGQESAIVTFGETASFMPMIQGILKQVRNSGELESIASQVIYKNDKFRSWTDNNGEQLIHEAMLFGERGERIGVFGLAKTKDGGVYIEVMTAEQVEAVKNVSRAKTKGPWAGDFEDEMWRKTVLRRLCKRLPKSTDLEGLMKADDELFMPPSKDVAAEPPPSSDKNVKRASKTSRLVQESVAATAPVEIKPETPAPATRPEGVKNYAPGAEGSPI